MQRRTFLKNLGLLVSAPAFLGIGHAASSQASREVSRIRVLTCNIRVDAAADAKSGDSWAERKQLCGDVIAAHAPDLVGFQEVQMPHFTYLKQRFPDFTPFGLYAPGKVPSPMDVIFFSQKKFEMISAGGFWLSEKPHIAGSSSWDSAHSRLVNWVDLAVRESGRKLRFWNTHLDHISQKARENGARLIVEACTSLPADLPQVLTGDLNSGGTNPAIKILKASGWVDTFAAVHGAAEPGFTGHGFRGEKAPDKRGNGSEKEKIDWVFCRGPAKPAGAEIIKDSRNGHYPSDHFFVSGDITL